MRTSLLLATAASVLAGCAAQPARPGIILAVGAESQYTSVISQIGGRYVDATSVMSNPGTDPHSFEASAQVASAVSSAQLVVQNGLGYDSFMTKIEAASTEPNRTIIVAQKVLGLPDSTRNPHLWYSPRTMPAVATAVEATLARLQPSHRAYFEANLATFTASMAKVTAALAAFKAAHPSVPVATTEPVADYLLEAAGVRVLTPWALRAATMNGTDPAPQDVAKQNALISRAQVRVLVYNEQVTDSVTNKYLALAKSHRVPIVGVYETMPAHGFTYQSWMLAEIAALDRAISTGTSTGKP